MMKHFFFLLFLLSQAFTSAQAAQFTAKMYKTDGNSNSIGTVVLEDGPYGLIIKTQLNGLPPGIHGFHIHQNPSCNDGGMAAGGHFDPDKTNTHQGPFGKGHAGDLPVLVVDATGTANTVLLAPRLKTKDLKNLTLMIHAGGDNYTDNPPLGGGGARIACGVIKQEGVKKDA